MIVSFIKGRVRLRSPIFSQPDFSYEAFEKYPGLKKITLNPITSSLLIEYDPEIIDQELTKTALTSLDPEAKYWFEDFSKPQDNWLRSKLAELTGNSINPNQATSEFINLTVAFLICAGSGFFGSKKLHTKLGLALGAMVAQHVFRYRSRINLAKYFNTEYLKFKSMLKLIVPDDDNPEDTEI